MIREHRNLLTVIALLLVTGPLYGHSQDESPQRKYIRWYNEQLRHGPNNDNSSFYSSGQLSSIKARERELDIDQAWFTVNSTVHFDLEVWAQSHACHKCDLMFITRLDGLSTSSLPVNCTYRTDLRLVRVHPGGHKEQICSFQRTFRENGDYWVFIDFPRSGEDYLIECEILEVNDPTAAELPILYVLLGLVALCVLYVAAKYLYKYLRRVAASRQDSMDVTSVRDGGDVMNMSHGSGTIKESDTDEASKPEIDLSTKRPRLKSLDTFRGLTLTLMIFVNYGGGRYWFFEHAPWNGLYVADLVFPWFVFIMGVSINFSFRSMLKQSWGAPRVTWRLVWRAARLFAIGFMLGTHHYQADLGKVRVVGVLQRLALTYLISSLVHYCVVRKFDSHQDRKWAPVRDVILYLPEWGINLAILAIHLGIVYGLPVPGCPTGYVGPGGLSEGGHYWNCTGGATQYVDSFMLGTQHMYHWPTPQHIYQTSMPFDPEGFLGTLGCVFLCFLGIHCGRIIQTFQDHKQRVVRFLAWAAILGALAAFFTKCSQNDGWIPPNKNLWSLSYTLITACFAFILLSALYVLVDVVGIWKGQPFIYPGMNSIVIYCCSEIFYKQFPVSWVVSETHLKLLMMSVWSTGVWIAFAYWLFLKKIFIAL